jgi:hypothetical protein
MPRCRVCPTEFPDMSQLMSHVRSTGHVVYPRRESRHQNLDDISMTPLRSIGKKHGSGKSRLRQALEEMGHTGYPDIDDIWLDFIQLKELERTSPQSMPVVSTAKEGYRRPSCRVCGEHFDNMQILMSHVKSMGHQNGPCRECGVEFPDVVGLIQHFKSTGHCVRR